MTDKKTHYRKVYKSNHLGVADLEDYMENDVILKFNIKVVKQEIGAVVAGRKGDYNIAYFEEKGIKPWVINATNATILSGFARSSFVEDWSGLYIQLYIDHSVKMKGDIVGGVRVFHVQPKKVLPQLEKSNTVFWNRAIMAYKRDKNFNAVLKHMAISKQDIELLKYEAENQGNA